MWGDQALERLLTRLAPGSRVLDIGAGPGDHAARLRTAGHLVTTCGIGLGYDLPGPWPLATRQPCAAFDAVWACHVLEHSRNPGAFLDAAVAAVRRGGWLVVTVPPAKYPCVGGHVTLWTAGTLLYQLVLAGVDCRNALVGSYGYNLSVVVERGEPPQLPPLSYDAGDLARLRPFLPDGLDWLGPDSFDGRIPAIHWELEHD